MTQHWADREKMKANLSASGRMGHIYWFIAIIFAIVGIIGDAANVTLGLEPASWFLLAIITLLASITFFIGWAVSWYLNTIATQKKE